MQLLELIFLDQIIKALNLFQDLATPSIREIMLQKQIDELKEANRTLLEQNKSLREVVVDQSINNLDIKNALHSSRNAVGPESRFPKPKYTQKQNVSN